jgi:GNAT superfamily N-acetyltransferase
MRIRPLTDNDFPAVAQLMRSLSLEFFLDEGSLDAAERFVRDNDETGLRGFVGTGIVYHVAERDDQLLGFIAVREHQHLFHMFVDKRYHRQGNARALWTVARLAALEAGNPGVFTVNASNHALPVYLAMGFVQTQATQLVNGLYFNPMQLDGRHSD